MYQSHAATRAMVKLSLNQQISIAKYSFSVDGTLTAFAS